MITEIDDDFVVGWILLAIAYASQKEPAKLRDISSIADGINKTPPLESELQLAIRVLTSKKIIVKIGKKYKLSDSGNSLMKDVHYNCKSTPECLEVLILRIKNGELE